MKKKLIFSIIILGIIGCAYAYYMYNKPVAGLSNQKAAHAIGANELLSKYEADEAEANTLYLDKVVEVTGEIDKIEFSNNKTSIYLLTENMMSSIICELEQNHSELRVKKGDSVTIKGLCTGYLMDVVLVRSLII